MPLKAVQPRLNQHNLPLADVLKTLIKRDVRVMFRLGLVAGEW